MLKFLRVMFLFVRFIFEALALDLLFQIRRSSDRHRHQRRALLISKYADQMLFILQIRCEIRRIPPKIASGLIVCNHLSYIDAVVIAKAVPSLFITSMEVRNSLGLGVIARLAGCLFVERRSRQGLETESRKIGNTLMLGTPVVLFPEGTSSDGSQILPFRAALYQSAIDSMASVHHFHLRYSNPSVAYFGEMEFASHLWRLCQQKQIWASLTYLGETKPTPNSDRKYLAQESFERIRENHVLGV